MSNPFRFCQQKFNLVDTKPDYINTIGKPEMIIQSMGINVAPFDRQSLLKNDSDDMPFMKI
jgi:hypothetical protein